jgi:hypothetical protein
LFFTFRFPHVRRIQDYIVRVAIASHKHPLKSGAVFAVSVDIAGQRDGSARRRKVLAVRKGERSIWFIKSLSASRDHDESLFFALPRCLEYNRVSSDSLNSE